MNPDALAGIVVALTRVTAIGEQLLEGDSEGHVRRSIAEFATAFARRDAIEPAVARMRESLIMLHDSRQNGSRHDFEQDQALIVDLDNAIEQYLLPELRRVGFSV